jgi:hypothetical protein
LPSLSGRGSVTTALADHPGRPHGRVGQRQAILDDGPHLGWQHGAVVLGHGDLAHRSGEVAALAATAAFGRAKLGTALLLLIGAGAVGAAALRVRDR